MSTHVLLDSVELAHAALVEYLNAGTTSRATVQTFNEFLTAEATANGWDAFPTVAWFNGYSQVGDHFSHAGATGQILLDYVQPSTDNTKAQDRVGMYVQLAAPVDLYGGDGAAQYLSLRRMGGLLRVFLGRPAPANASGLRYANGATLNGGGTGVGAGKINAAQVDEWGFVELPDGSGVGVGLKLSLNAQVN